MSSAIQIFYSYSEKDQVLIDELDAHLSTMKRLGLISEWQCRDVLAGMEREKEIRHYLDSAQIILLLISPDFIASDYCYSTEMSHALQRDQNGEARVIPIILRPTDIRDAPFSHLQMLPRNGIAVTMWADHDEAFCHIVTELRQVVQHTLKKSKEQWLHEGRILYKARRYEQALKAYEQVLRIDPSAALYEKQGNILFLLERFAEALDAYTYALHLESGSASIYINRGNALVRLKQYHLALLSYEEAIHLNADDPASHNNKGRTLFYLGRYVEAIVEFEEAIRLKPDFARAYEHMGDSLTKLNRPQQASLMYARAQQMRQKK